MRTEVSVEVLAANIESRRRSPMLRLHIKRNRPDVVIVEQAYRAHAFLREIPGYRFYGWDDRRGGEWNGIAVLVRNDLDVRVVRPLIMRQSWTGPKAGKRHEPRVYPVLVLAKRGIVFRVIGIHLPTHNQPGAQAESMDAVETYFVRHDNSPVIAAGDWNREAPSLAGLARQAVGRVLRVGKVDHALVRDVKGPRSRRLLTPPYAHGWALYSGTIRN